MTTKIINAEPITGRQVLGYFILAFGVIIAVNAILIVLSIRSFTGETQPRSYATGLDFNRTLEDVHNQRDRGWQVLSQLESPASGRAIVSVIFRDAQSLPLEGLSIVAFFKRPTNEGNDFNAPLEPQGDGRYAAHVDMPLSGKWNLRLVATHGDESPFLLDYKLVVK
jgi:nitrogen fixation protein FixH